MKKGYKSICAVLLVVLLIGLTGYGDGNGIALANAVSEAPSGTGINEEGSPHEAVGGDGTMSAQSSLKLTDEQKNSIAMLNHLTVLTKEIGVAANSRLYLENTYSSLVNNTYPNAVDGQTLTMLRNILDSLESFRMTAVKRERLEYLFEQSKAQRMRSAIPNPLGLMSAVQSFNPAKIIFSVLYMAVDAITSYETVSTQLDLQYLQDGWDLDDEEAEQLHDMRSEAFYYMVEIVNFYSLPGDLALNEESVTNFVAWKNETNLTRRVQLLEENKHTYEAYGPYWLLLAESYYGVERYADCLAAIETYEQMDARIFRKDYELVKVLPMVIDAASHVYAGKAYEIAAERYIGMMLDNTAIDDWALRYFAAQTQIELFGHTQNRGYLSSAYNLVLSNVTHLIGEQRELNQAYVRPLERIAVPKNASKENKKDIERYNQLLEEERKVALPPISDALRLNCDLLFALAAELDIPEAEKAKVDSILHHEAEPLFLVSAVDDLYWFVNAKTDTAKETDIPITFTKERLTLPAVCIASGADVQAVVTDASGSHVFADFRVTKVARKDDEDVSEFVATLESPTLKKYNIEAGADIQITIVPCGAAQVEPMRFAYFTEETKLWIVPTGVTYVRVAP